MTLRLLISVRNVDEARIAVAGGADLVDLKEPDAGALGAVPLDRARAVAAECAHLRPTSATVGDLPADAIVLAAAARRTAQCGVRFVKIGFLPEPGREVVGVIGELADVAHTVPLIAVMFADREWQGDAVAAAADAGFAGIMLDTANKSSGRLRDLRNDVQLAGFVDRARARGLLVGLAGSLRLEDVAPLSKLGPDYLGFRGAACAAHNRGGELQAARVSQLRRALDEVCADRRGEPMLLAV